MEPIEVVNWPSAVVMVAIILGPSILAWLQTRKTGAKVDESHAKLEAVAESLNNPNGGSSVRDALNRIEARIDDVEAYAIRAARKD